MTPQEWQAIGEFAEAWAREIGCGDIQLVIQLKNDPPEELTRPDPPYLEVRVSCDGRRLLKRHLFDPRDLLRFRGSIADYASERGRQAREEIREKCRQARDQT